MPDLFVNERISPRAADPDALVMYPHAQRTGGYTILKHVFFPTFGATRIYHPNYVPAPKRWRALADEDLHGYAAFTSMDDFRRIRIARPVLPIAVLRHPLYRAASLYHYVRRKAGHPEQELARNLGMEEFFYRASRGNPKYYCNVQCLRVCNEPDARLALEFIRSLYLAVGFTSELPEFARTLCRLLGRPEIQLKSKPPESERYDTQITPKFRDMVLEANREDLALFEAMSSGRSPVHAARRNRVPAQLAEMRGLAIRVVRKSRAAQKKLFRSKKVGP